MKRKAFLIGSPLQGKDYLKGVIPDVQNMFKHLCSNKGGAWERCEIEIFDNPSKKELLTSFHVSYDFVIIQYSGHGFEFKSNGDICLNINSDEYIPVKEIQKALLSPKGFFLVDCCRGYDYQNLIEATKMINFSKSNIDNYDAIRQNCRQRYEEIIDKCEKGYSYIFSCDSSEAAKEYLSPQSGKNLGGLFTYNFLNFAKNSKPDRKHYYSIRTVYNEATKKMSMNSFSSQHPILYPERRNNFFPFVIFEEENNGK